MNQDGSCLFMSCVSRFALPPCPQATAVTGAERMCSGLNNQKQHCFLFRSAQLKCMFMLRRSQDPHVYNIVHRLHCF
ncbi:hypothetical protein AOLI_G00324420 [Acnodon oligacanthus]